MDEQNVFKTHQSYNLGIEIADEEQLLAWLDW